MAKDYYKILGVDKSASENEIKKAYRKAAVKWHPDRWSDKSEKERKDAENKFKEIAEANEVLSNPEKRKKYDQFGENWNKVGDGFDGFDFGFDFMDDFFGGGRRQQRKGPIPGTTITMNYFVDINDIFNGVNKTIEIEIDGRCPDCEGTGGDSHECEHCHGTGQIQQVKNTPFGRTILQSTCPYCHGTGKIYTKKCSTCRGTGFIKKKRKININIKPFVKNHQPLKYTGMGYESKDKNGLNGDLIIQINYNIDTSKYVIDGTTVYEKIFIPYYDCILGCTKKVKLPNNKEKEITIKPLTVNGDKVILNGEGLNGGQYVFIIEPELPKRSLSSKLSDEEKELLTKIQKIHS